MASVRTRGIPYSGRADEIPPELRGRMEGVSWRPDDPRCPPFDALRLLTVSHWDFTGNPRTGQLVVADELADELLAIFGCLFEMGFPIERMEPVDSFAADDNASMAANNTSAFNFRNVAGTDVLSHHAFGVAIDINPLHNPMIIGGGVFPPGGASYVERSAPRPGMIVRPGPVVDLFQSHGWDWGGDWPHMKDYHHFFKPNRG
jgi:D-alanyl-D-alanine carboxypeptidase